MINFLFCTVLPPGASKVDQFHKFYDFLNLIQLFPMTSYSVLVEVTVQESLMLAKFSYFAEKNRFLVNFRGS